MSTTHNSTRKSYRPHPLKRISTGSISSLARSQDRISHASPAGLDFLAPAMTDLADEAATLAENIAKLNAMHDALGTFNEAFAGYMYALKMNAFCVEWPEAPTEVTFARRLAAEEAVAQASSALSSLSNSTSNPPPGHAPTTHHQNHQHPDYASTIEADQTYATESSVDEPAPVRKSSMKRSTVPASTASGAGVGAGPGAGGVKKTGVQANGHAAAAARRKRDLEVAGYIDMLPLEYRGQDPNMRLGMEKVIKKLLVTPDGCSMQDMVMPPDLPQVKVNKHLMALVQRKMVVKVPIGGKAYYQWVGV